MSVEFVIGLLGAGMLSGMFAWLAYKLVYPSPAAVATPEWIRSFSPRRYQPMERLLRRDDYLYLSAQPGCDPSLLRRFRATRSKIFRRYLRSLALDFNRLHLTVRLLLLTSKRDQPELAKELLRLRVAFSALVLAAHAKLALHALGYGGPAIEVRPLVSSLDKLFGQLQLLAAPAMSSRLSS